MRIAFSRIVIGGTSTYWSDADGAASGWNLLILGGVLLVARQVVFGQVLGAKHWVALHFSRVECVDWARALAVVQVLGLGDVQDGALGERVSVE